MLSKIKTLDEMVTTAKKNGFDLVPGGFGLFGSAPGTPGAPLFGAPSPVIFGGANLFGPSLTKIRNKVEIGVSNEKATGTKSSPV